MRQKRAKQIQAFKQTIPQTLPIQKIFSTSITYKPKCLPQWISDTKISYMSHFDFISYDLDDEKVTLTPKPQDHNVLAVKFCDLAGQNNMRIVYLCKEEVQVENEGNETEKQYMNEFSFIVLPSLTLSDQFYSKKVKIHNRKIQHIENFSYFPDGQYVVFPALFDDNTISIVYMGLATSTLIYYDILTDGWKAENENQIGSLFHVSATLKSFKNIYEQQEESSELRLFKMSYLSPTKELNEFVLVYGKTMFLLQLFYGQKQFKLLSTCKIDSLSKIKKVRQTQPFKASQHIVTLNLSKTYFVVKQGFTLLLYSIDQSTIRSHSALDTKSTSLVNQISSISASFNSNKIIICTQDKNCMYQFKVNEPNSTIEYLNCVDLDVQYHEGCINKVVISDNGRNAAFFMLNQLNGSQKNGYVVINFLIFKIQLYSELDIPQTSLYIKKPKYQNRYKKVHRLVLPKVHQQLYALTGSEVHMFKSHRISGVMFFDVHPCGFYMVICYAFNIKIYSLQFNSMTLLHSTSMQNLKKVLYSPDGSTMVIFSTRKIKILNSYSFQQNFQTVQKANSIMDICFAPKRKTFFTIFDNGLISERSFLDYEKVNIYRIFGNTHHKIVVIKIDQRNQTLLILLDDGGLIVKNISDFTADQKCFYYEDQQKISQIYVDIKNHIVFIGTKNGKLRLHDVSIESFNIETFSQVPISYSQITAITTSFLQNSVCVGSTNGDITKLRYIPFCEGSMMQRNSRQLKKAREKVSPYMNFQFMLVSAAKFNGNSQQNALQDKLENLFEKIQHHSSTYKNSLINSYEQKQKDLCEHEMQQNRLAYRDFDAKSKKIKNDIILVKEKSNKQKKQIIEEYEQKIRQIFIIQDKLLNEKKELQKKYGQRKKCQLTQNEKQKNALTVELHQQAEGNQFFYKKEVFTTELKDLDDDYKINDGAVLSSLRKSIDEELTTLKVKCKELNKSNGYLQTARQNMRSRRVQEETLEHRISQELSGLGELSEQQKTKIESLSEQLKLTEDVIHRIQNKVKNRKNNEISSDKADNDLCSYKIWMKEKVQEEISQLREYLDSLERNFDKKSRDMTHVMSKIKGTHSVIEQMSTKKEELKQKLKILRDQLVIMKNQNINARKSVQSQSLLNYVPDASEIQNLKIKKIISIQRLNEKANHAAKKQVIIHERKLKNLNLNNAELLNQYQKLKFQNKWLCDRRRQCITDLRKVKQNIDEENNKRKGFQSQRNSLHTRDTPFQKYIKQRASRTKRSMNLNCIQNTASNSHVPSRMSSAVVSPMMRTTIKFF